MSVSCFSQDIDEEKTKILTDTTLLMAKPVIGKTTIGTKIDNSRCDIEYYYGDKKYPYDFNNDDIFIVSGIYECETDLLKIVDFFKIIYNEKEYYVKKNDIVFGHQNNYFQQIKNFSPSQSEKFRETAKQWVLAYEEYKEDAKQQRIKELIDFVNNCKSSGIVITNWNIYDESEYTDGTGVEIRYLNPTTKTIKYIWTTIVGYNPVKDKVKAKSGQYNTQIKSVGPIAPNETGLYQFNYVWFTDIVETAKIVSIRIQYMDGTEKNVYNADKITMSDEFYNTFSQLK
jgi:hypothetical protein